MTTANEAKTAIYDRFLANFTGLSSDRIAFDNEEFEEGDAGDPWVRLFVRGLVRQQDTLGAKGNRKFRPQATVFVQVYVQFNTGVSLSDALAQEAADIFEGESFSGLDFQAANKQEIGPDGRWFLQTVEAPFFYEEIK